MPRSNQCAGKKRGPSQSRPVTLHATESAVRIRMLGMFAPKVASESVPIAAAMREQSDGESAERELAEGEDATQDHVRCRVVPDPAHGWQCLADHDAAKDDVDQQSGQRREYRDGLPGNQAPAVGHIA